MNIIQNLFYLVNQRLPVLAVAAFFAIVLFNTTYMSLGTNVPLAVIFLGIIFFISNGRNKENKQNRCFVWMAIVILCSTMLSGGDQFRDCFKVLLTAFFVYFASSIKINDFEVKYLSFIICVSYFVYAILVTLAIGQDTEYYGRAQIRILNSEIPLDPNVVAAVFVLPIIISLYNLLYGKYKLLAGGLLLMFAIAIIALGSRGATVSCLASSCLLILKYFTSRSTKLWIKLFSITLILFIAYLVYDFITEQGAIFGFERILDFSGDDASNGRTGVWAERLNLFVSSPLWGYGMNYNVGTVHRGMACHNTFIQCLHYGGFIGICLFLIPLVSLLRRKSISQITKYSLFISVLMPIIFIDTLQERTLWNFVIFYSLLSMRNNAEECLIWDITKDKR